MAGLTLSTLLLLLLPEVALPRPTELTAAAADPVELERLTTRLGPGRTLALIEEAASHRQARLTTAALRGAGLMGAAQPELGVQLLRPLCETLHRLGLAKRLDERQAAVAGEALSRVATAVGQESTCSEADGADCGGALGDAADALAGLAADGAMALPLRSAALDGLSALPPASWQRLLPGVVQLATVGPPPPSPQRAALLLLSSLVLRERPEPLYALLRSGEPAVASAAAAELCPLLTPALAKGKAPHSLAALPEDVAARLRSLAATGQPLAQRQQTSECLRLLGTAQDRSLLQSMASEARRGRR